MERAVRAERERVDATQPSVPRFEHGSLHPVTQTQQSLEDLFLSMGFSVLDGPQLESDYYNFTAVNVPPTHPARDMQDTFYVEGLQGLHGQEGTWVMRTHTSSMQVRALRAHGAPLRMIAPGRCFRNEATDVRHEHTFHQLEGVVVDKGMHFGHLKGVLETVAKHLYGPKTRVRLRPKFYPFVEPGVNGEVTCYLCHGDGCRLCKKTGWLEVFGAGMIHPNVLREGGVDPAVYSGFAFGFGLTRLVMLKYGIDDIRHLERGDLRFLKQF
jgi:phenylalanyl-tRNA synthetase alpha chain